jgi:1-acyl-sn-glycerol-3-phosphate acyltransferase
MRIQLALRGAWRLTRTVIHIGHALLIVATEWPSLDAAARQRRIIWWAKRHLELIGIRHELVGQFDDRPVMIVANHVSWLDIMAIFAACPRARFVSKADVKAWPVLGWLIASVGTLFIERERKRDALRVVHHVAQALAEGQTIAVFPEGTTSDGHGVTPFHANLLQAAIAVGADIQPVMLRYPDHAKPVSASVAWVGADTLAASMWRIACADGLRVRVVVLPTQSANGADRRTLSDAVHRAIADRLAADIG